MVWRFSSFVGFFTVRVPGQEDQKYSEFCEAADAVIRSKKYTMLFDPCGDLMLTKGSPS